MLTNPGLLIQHICIMAIPLIFAISLHEAAHGWVANKLGDSTALMLGRVSLNPLKHIDLFGTILLPFLLLMLGGILFGYAKPVPISWQQLRKPRRDMALVALAGPAANLVMAIFWAGVLTSIQISHADLANSPLITQLAYFTLLSARFGIQINVFLMLLNLLPIPPLDGSRVISSLLPPALAIRYEFLEPYGLWILLALIFLGILTTLILPLANSIIIFIIGLF